jgi:hypothetical protein
MKPVNVRTTTALAGALLVLWTFQAAAAVRESSATSRDAAISRCLAQAHRQYPGKYWDWGQARGFVYRACIFDAGFPP